MALRVEQRPLKYLRPEYFRDEPDLFTRPYYFLFQLAAVFSNKYNVCFSEADEAARQILDALPAGNIEAFIAAAETTSLEENLNALLGDQRDEVDIVRYQPSGEELELVFVASEPHRKLLELAIDEESKKQLQTPITYYPGEDPCAPPPGYGFLEVTHPGSTEFSVRDLPPPGEETFAFVTLRLENLLYDLERVRFALCSVPAQYQEAFLLIMLGKFLFHAGSLNFLQNNLGELEGVAIADLARERMAQQIARQGRSSLLEAALRVLSAEDLDLHRDIRVWPAVFVLCLTPAPRRFIPQPDSIDQLITIINNRETFLTVVLQISYLAITNLGLLLPQQKRGMGQALIAYTKRIQSAFPADCLPSQTLNMINAIAARLESN